MSGSGRGGTAPKKRHGLTWRHHRNRGGATWAQRRSISATYCEEHIGGRAEASSLESGGGAPTASRLAVSTGRSR